MPDPPHLPSDSDGCAMSAAVRGSFPDMVMPHVAIMASMCLSPHLFIHIAGIMLRLPAHL